MAIEKPVKVNNHGMISIPAEIRKKYGIKDGDKVYVLEDEDGIRIIPIVDIDVLRRKININTADMLEFMDKERKKELEIEKD
jgi:AbrB family looped-hinge helix DNA binding protein